MTSRKPLAAVCGATMFLYAAYLTSFGLLRPQMGANFGLDDAQSGRLVAVSFSGFICGVLIGGPLSDRIGRKAVILFGFALNVVGMIAVGGAPTLPLLMVAIALMGLGYGSSLTTATAFASELFPERQAMIQGVINSLFGIGAILSPLITGVVLQSGTRWSVVFLGLAAMNALAFMALAILRVPRQSASLPHPPASPPKQVQAEGENQHRATQASPLRTLPLSQRSGERGQGGEGLRAALLSPTFLLLCLAQILYAGTEVSYWVWMPSLFKTKFANGAEWASSIVALFWFAMTLGRFGFGIVAGRMPLLRLNAILGLLTAAGMILSLLMPAPVPALAAIFLTGLPLSGVLIINLAAAGERFRQGTGTIIGGMVASGGIGATVVPYGVSAVASNFGWTVGLSLPVLGAFGITAVSLALLRSDKNS